MNRPKFNDPPIPFDFGMSEEKYHDELNELARSWMAYAKQWQKYALYLEKANDPNQT